ncbi:uncharacterized protein A4U43_C08F13080 [Asparagus officinalis]|uniref:uncharacterized protein LOC109819665 n=1 Tax=Asparagus officinalis TaxID=4686 RepID=UPI00098E15B5|nr:uncharacterized protein LOC109819665 [Asparagus officinalis]ONK59993.1 uncharacterized protein A4U43_C08F13080 [Asparagus officinalis]
MGKRKQNKSAIDLSNISDTDSVSSTATALSDLTLAHETENVNSLDAVVERCLDSLDKKSSRLKALSELVNAFEGNTLLPFIENKCITLLDEYITSLKKGKGSPTEACLASRAIGLLAITVGTGSTAKEIMEQTLPHIERALLTGSDALKISVLDCLAVTTFVGANNWEETEKSMKIMWDIIQLKPGTKGNKPSTVVLSSALSGWSLLLTTIGSWRINLDNWTEPISGLCTLLEHDDRAVRVAAGEAIAITFEIVIGDKLSSENNDLVGSDTENYKPKWFKQLLSSKAKIMNQVVVLSMEAGGKSAVDKKNLNNQRDLFQKIYKYFLDKECPETSTKISKGHGLLVTSTWTQLIQLNFFKRYLASGFLKHAQENELLQDIFNLTPDRNDHLSSKEKRVNRSSEYKERTRERNKYRQMAQQRKGGHIFAYDE